jgi:hypothetical protein
LHDGDMSRDGAMVGKPAAVRIEFVKRRTHSDLISAPHSYCPTHRYLLLRLTVSNTGEDFDAPIDSLLKAFGRLNRYGRPGREGVMTVMGQKGLQTASAAGCQKVRPCLARFLPHQCKLWISATGLGQNRAFH